MLTTVCRFLGEKENGSCGDCQERDSPPETYCPRLRVDDETAEGGTGRCSQKLADLVTGEGLTTIVREEQVQDDATSNGRRHRTKQPAQEAGDDEADIVIFCSQLARPNRAGKTSQ